MDIWYGTMLFSCHGVVRSGLPDGLVFWFCHGDVRSVYRWFKDGVHGTVHRWFLWYGISMVFRVWYIVGLYGMVHS